MKAKNIWELVKVGEAWSRTGRAPVTTRWVDTDKGAGVVRSRLVARDFKTKDSCREDLFAATPPLELLRAMLSKAAGSKDLKVMIVDVKKAHLYPFCDKDVYVELPEEAGLAPGMCGKLVHWLYGFRPAAQAWENDYSHKLEDIGFVRGLASPVSFWSRRLGTSCLVHGDDFVFVGGDDALDYVEKKMRENGTR